MTPYRLIILENAEAEFKREIEYSASFWGKRHAAHYARALRAVVKEIAVAPFASPLREDCGQGVRMRRYKGNMVAYRVHKEIKTIEIIGFPSVHRMVQYDNGNGN
jgi:plasmid stabilization system protein ParE